MPLHFRDRALGAHDLPLSPYAYLQHTNQGKVLRHLGRSASAPSPRRNITIVGGDFNGIWDRHLGSLRLLLGWAAQSSLLSPIAAVDTPDPLCSYFMGGAPKSLVDHLLLSQPCQGSISHAGLYTKSFSGSMSDYRPFVSVYQLCSAAHPSFPWRARRPGA